MSIIRYALSGNFNNFNKKINVIAKKTNKNKISLMFNFLYCFVFCGAGYSDYLNYELYKRSKKEIKEYATIKTQDKFYAIVSPSKYKDFFSVKANFLKNFSKYIKRDSFYNGSLDELKKFLKKHKSIMYKPVNGLGGKDVKKINTKEIKDIPSFYNEIIENNILLEEVVVQHKKVSEFAENSCNTIRVMTFSYNGKSRIMCAMMRFGNGINDVDNFHKGGMGVLVDVDTGTLIGDAINKNNEHFSHHPVSKKKFDGFKIPNWDIIKSTCLEAALVSDKIHVVGWDVAVLEDGCTFIEGNRRPGWDLPQVLMDKGRRDLMREIINEINESEGTNYKI